MIQWTLVFLGTGLLSLQWIAVSAQSNSYRAECDSWNQTVLAVNSSTSQGGALNVSCNVNGLACSGFNCIGNIAVASVKEDLSFGMRFIPCTQPIAMEIFVNVGGVLWRNNTITVNNLPTTYVYDIPGANKTFPGASVSGNASILLQSIASSNPAQAVLEVNFTLRAVVLGSPTIYNYVIVPRRSVALPSCIIAPSTTRMETPAMTSPTTPRPPPTGPGKACTIGAVHQCDDHQQCYQSKCMCLNDYIWNEKVCVKQSKDGDPTTAQSNDTASAIPTSAPANDHTLMIILSCIGVALGLGVVVAVIRCRYVRYRQRYGQHDLLVNEADNNLDEVDPPMIEA